MEKLFGMVDSKFDEAFVKALIETEALESVHLDFKRGDSLYFKEGKADKREELAKDISAFANSDGGILVYGIEEQDHRAHELTFVDETRVSKLGIEDVLKNRIRKNIKGIGIHYILIENDPKQLIVAFNIPRSNDAPHMVGNKFYKRFQTLSAPMEEYEVRDSYFRTSKPVLQLDIQTERSGRGGELKIIIRNISAAIAYDYKLIIDIPAEFMSAAYESQRRKLREYYIGDRSPYYYSIPNRSPLFPIEENVILQFTFHTIQQSILSDAKIRFEVVIYYDGGFERKDFCFMEETIDGSKT